MNKNLSDLQEFVAEIAQLYGERIAYRYYEGAAVVDKSYLELQRDVNAIATWMTEKHWKGKHVAILGGSSYAWIVTGYKPRTG